MGKTLDLGRRFELHSMDRHCRNITLGLYRREVEGSPRYMIHTYSSREGAAERVQYITRALVVMLGMEEVADAPGWVRFPCGVEHGRALRRAFLDLCKLETGAPLAPKPLTVFDKKADGYLTAAGLENGVYEMRSENGDKAGERRAAALTRGFIKLCEMNAAGEAGTRAAFPCRCSHDEMIGMLMFRAQNVRGAMQEEELSTSRGMLTAPSQQS